jgi:hypothetical protein
MTLNDYLLNHESVDWNESLQAWGWLLPERFTLWMANRFGDCFIVLNNGSVEMLDVSAGRIEKLANSRDEFAEKIDLDDNAELWLMIPLVDQLVAAGVTLTPDKCYGFCKPIVLGGEYAMSNVAVMPIQQYLLGCGKLHEQLKDVADGEQVVLRTDFGKADET